MSVEIEVVRSDGGGAAVVALDTADGDDGVGLLLHGVGHQELEFPDFVSAQFHPREVVSLDPELGAVGEIGEVPSMDRSRTVSEGEGVGRKRTEMRSPGRRSVGAFREKIRHGCCCCRHSSCSYA